VIHRSGFSVLSTCGSSVICVEPAGSIVSDVADRTVIGYRHMLKKSTTLERGT